MIQTKKSPTLNSLILHQSNHLYLYLLLTCLDFMIVKSSHLISLHTMVSKTSHMYSTCYYTHSSAATSTTTPTPASRHWLSLTHSMRHFTSDSILLRHHNRHNFSQSSLPIASSSSSPQSPHPELYVRNSTSLPNSTPLSKLRQLLATQVSGTHPSSSFAHMSVSGKQCPSRPVKHVSLPKVGTPITKKEESSETKHTDSDGAYWVDLEPQTEGIRRIVSSSAHFKGRGLKTHKRSRRKVHFN